MLVPLRGKILVEVLPGNNMTESGLYLTPKEEVPHRGRVISMGAPFRNRKNREFPWGFSVGHIVHFKRSWDFNKVKHYVLRRDMIYAIEHESKAYAIAEYIIVKKTQEIGEGRIYIPSHFETEIAKQVDYGIVMSVGRDDKMGISEGDKIMYYKNEGMSVRIPLQEELWSLKPRAVLAKI